MSGRPETEERSAGGAVRVGTKYRNRGGTNSETEGH
jgi:hypothetical protein